MLLSFEIDESSDHQHNREAAWALLLLRLITLNRHPTP
ncbi:hypothetical protein SynBIOSU31_02152 [Synechococcus sp. BIOS-U3-1]|nr:hypothetical protein SynBIOSU31_02152 [Synechococcus sp. BIOS-U3-1]